jgi:8-oxo-dGTP pyrophosphatase MutT (NUDIX family)
MSGRITIPNFISSWSASLETSVGGVVYSRLNDRIVFLLLHYPHGHWDFPKGHIEEGETELQTLRREVQEETGITGLEVDDAYKEIIRFWYIAKGEERKKRLQSKQGIIIFKKVLYYLCYSKTLDVKFSEEHQDIGWFSFDVALKKVTFDNSKHLLRAAHDRLKEKKEIS